MEDIIQILIFVGAMVIAVIGQNTKNRKKPTTTSPQEVLKDMFPEIKVVQEAPVVEPKPTPKPEPVLKRKPRTGSTSPQSPQPVVSQSSKKKQKISLSHREEAKRAFIYSEIFKRKY